MDPPWFNVQALSKCFHHLRSADQHAAYSSHTRARSIRRLSGSELGVYRYVYDMEDILADDGISLIAKIPPSRLYRDGPEAITRELGETLE